MGKAHAIMIPLPHQGHINPFISLALKFASKGFAITFVNLEFIHHRISNTNNHLQLDLFSRSGYDIRCTTIDDGLPLEFDRDLRFVEFYDSMFRHLPSSVDRLVAGIVEADPNSVHFLVTDTFYSWPASVANKYNLVNVSFWTEPALVFSLVYHSHLLTQKGHYPLKDGVEEEVDYVPGVQSINTRDFMPYLKEESVPTLSQKVVFGAFEVVTKADFILHNTVHELESQTISALNNYQPNYAVGPINFSMMADDVDKSLWSPSNCTGWLDSKPPGAVLYVSFGSLVQMSKQVIEEIACGLLQSEVNFIWVVRSGVTGSYDPHILPDGFVDEVKDRGLIVQWCDQLRVLSHPAVGGFLTHCGWNSVLESIWCGVPMICYPLDYDQPANRKLVVDDWKVGISLCDGSLVNRKEVCDKVKVLMNGCFNQELEKVKMKLQNAVGIDGSSERNFDQFIMDLKVKLYLS